MDALHLTYVFGCIDGASGILMNSTETPLT